MLGLKTVRKCVQLQWRRIAAKGGKLPSEIKSQLLYQLSYRGSQTTDRVAGLGGFVKEGIAGFVMPQWRRARHFSLANSF